MAFCVGQRTARVASEQGWNVCLVAENADALMSGLTASHAPMRLLHLAGRHRRGNIAERLGAAGWDVTVTALYDQRLCPLSASARSRLAGEAAVILPLFSPRTATHLASQLEPAPGAVVIAMSEAVKNALGAARFAEVITATAPDAEGMGKAIELWVQRNRLT